MLRLEEYAYGTFKGHVNCSFLKTEKEVEEWIEESLQYTLDMKQEELEAGESLVKWSAKFKWKGISYFVYLDI